LIIVHQQVVWGEGFAKIVWQEIAGRDDLTEYGGKGRKEEEREK
jgi:hypothetical protein